MSCYLAIDIGASSGRHILGSIENGKIVLEELHRFENRLIKRSDSLCWDIEYLFDNIVAGMKKASKCGKIPKSVSIDTWGVDFILLDGEGEILRDSIAYRTFSSEENYLPVESIIPPETLYCKTGTQKQPFNTIYQLAALKKRSPEMLKRAESFLMIPDYLAFRLTGKAENEYTNCSTTGLLNAESKTWDAELIAALGLPEKLFRTAPKLPGTALGTLKEEIAREIGYDCTVLLAPSHDTASAFLAVPAENDSTVFISSGTWSLLGVELDRPLTDARSREANFTNEGGYDYRFRYLKNIMGMWMVQCIERNLGGEYTVTNLVAAAESCKDFSTVIDVNDASFIAPESMINAIQDWCRQHGKTVPESIGEIMQCVYLSLAHSYKSAIDELTGLTGKEYTGISIVGGGSNNEYLNRLTSEICKLPVSAGPSEATAVGNIISQLLAHGELNDIHEARRLVRQSFDVKYQNYEVE